MKHHLLILLSLFALVTLAVRHTPLENAKAFAAASSFWYEKVEHNGRSPFIDDPDSYKIFRNVVDYGADASGNSDSSAAIQKAIAAGSSSAQRGSGTFGTTLQPAVVYFPAGTYRLDSPLQLYVGTVLMGNPLSLPTLKASSGFNGDVLVYGKDPKFDATINFYLAIRNIILDSTSVDKDKTFLLLDWSVSQATQLANVKFNMPLYSAGHTGLATPEGGSGTMMGDLTFTGGSVGIRMDNQQYEAKTLHFDGCTTGILISHCFDCVFVDVSFGNMSVGIDMSSSGNTIGSVLLIDATASNIGTVVSTKTENSGDHTLLLENFKKGTNCQNVVQAGGEIILSDNVDGVWLYGNAYIPGGPNTGAHQTGTLYNNKRSQGLLNEEGKYVSIPPPTFSSYNISQVVNVKSVKGYPVYGDGVKDDTNSLNYIIKSNNGKVLYFPHGTYKITDTLFFPANSLVHGEVWSTISGFGNSFKDENNPKAIIKVGNAGDVGVAKFTDLLFTVGEVLPGAKLVEVNIKAKQAGDVGFWNTHFRIGGARGSSVQTDCGNLCKAAFVLLHLTPSSSAYIENMWGWTADHDLDGGGFGDISVGRGMLCESQQETWLHGTAFEHHTIYEYSFRNAKEVFVGMQQSETPYWQGPGSTLAPSPWSPNQKYGDPDFSGCGGDDGQCRMSWFSHVTDSSDLFFYGSGFWAFFNNHGGCNGDCQKNAISINNAHDVHWFGINTKSCTNVIVNNGQSAVTEYYNPGSWGAVVGAFLIN